MTDSEKIAILEQQIKDLWKAIADLAVVIARNPSRTVVYAPPVIPMQQQPCAPIPTYTIPADPLRFEITCEQASQNQIRI